jgi:hypothetical protein
MSALQSLPSFGTRRGTVFLLGTNPWTHGLALKQCVEAGLRVVVARTLSDESAGNLAAIHRNDQVAFARSVHHDSEILPDAADTISASLLARLRKDYGDECYALPLNDYVTEYAAAFSSRLSGTCYPRRAAVIVKRKHELRNLWNELAERSAGDLQTVPYCYMEQREGSDEFDYYPSGGFDALPEKTAFVVKPDELSASIEIHRVESKREALQVARQVCFQLISKWSKVGKKIGTEVRPRVLVEVAIERSAAVHPGAEYSAEFVSCQGRHNASGITQKWTGPGFIEIGHLVPAESLPARLRGVLEQSISAMLQELEVQYGVSHWEFIVTPEERIALVEGHLRPAGGRILELVQHSTGISPVAALYNCLLGGSVDFSSVPRQHCGLFWMVPQALLSEVNEIRIDRDVTNKLCLDLFVNEDGIKATPNWSRATDWTKRFAHVMAAGDNLDDIRSRCREVARAIILYGKANERPATTQLVLAVDSE